MPEPADPYGVSGRPSTAAAAPPRTGQVVAARGVGAGGAIGDVASVVLAQLTITVPVGSKLVIDASAYVLNGGVAQDTFTVIVAIDGTPIDTGQVALSANQRALLSRAVITNLLTVGTYTVTLEGVSQAGRSASTAVGGARLNAFAVSLGV